MRILNIILGFAVLFAVLLVDASPVPTTTTTETSPKNSEVDYIFVTGEEEFLEKMKGKFTLENLAQSLSDRALQLYFLAEERLQEIFFQLQCFNCYPHYGTFNENEFRMKRKPKPEIKLKNGDVISGIQYITSASEHNADQHLPSREKWGIDTYMGIPYAEPPVGDLRFKHPVAYNQSLHHFKARKLGPSCINSTPFAYSGMTRKKFESMSPKTKTAALELLIKSRSSSEDCLTLNVYRPVGHIYEDNRGFWLDTEYGVPHSVPVVVVFQGGFFQLGGSKNFDPVAKQLIADSMKMKTPIIVVTLNSRLGPFGYLGGKAVHEEGSANAGLYDQRLALQWVAENIESFGGDPSRVTIYGESTGAVSVAHHMVANDGDHTYKGKPLFHGAVMRSGAAWSFDSVTSAKPEAQFQQFSRALGCNMESSKESMVCLRKRPTLDIQMAQNFNHGPEKSPISQVYDTFFAWAPRSDGELISENPYELIRQQKFAKVPYVIGTQEEDENIFMLYLDFLTTKTDKKVLPYTQELLFNANKDKIKDYLSLMPKDQEKEDIGKYTSWYEWRKFHRKYLPGNMVLAQVLQDTLFDAPRLNMLENTPKDVSAWAYYVERPDVMSRPDTDTANLEEFNRIYRDRLAMPFTGFRYSLVAFITNQDPDALGYRQPENRPPWKQYHEGSLMLKMGSYYGRRYTADEIAKRPRARYVLANPDLIKT